MSATLMNSYEVLSGGVSRLGAEGKATYERMFGQGAPIPREAAFITHGLTGLIESAFNAGFDDPTRISSEMQLVGDGGSAGQRAYEMTSLFVRFGGGLEQVCAALTHLASSQVETSSREVMRQLFGTPQIPDAVPVAVGLAMKELGARYQEHNSALDAERVIAALKSQVSLLQFFLAAQIEKMATREKTLIEFDTQTSRALAGAPHGAENVGRDAKQIISSEQQTLRQKIAAAKQRFVQFSSIIGQVSDRLGGVVYSAVSKAITPLELSPSRAIPMTSR